MTLLYEVRTDEEDEVYVVGPNALKQGPFDSQDGARRWLELFLYYLEGEDARKAEMMANEKWKEMKHREEVKEHRQMMKRLKPAQH